MIQIPQSYVKRICTCVLYFTRFDIFLPILYIFCMQCESKVTTVQCTCGSKTPCKQDSIKEKTQSSTLTQITFTMYMCSTVTTCVHCMLTIVMYM